MIDNKKVNKIAIDRIIMLSKELYSFSKDLAKEIMIKGYGINNDDLYTHISLMMLDIIPYFIDFEKVKKTLEILPKNEDDIKEILELLPEDDIVDNNNNQLTTDCQYVSKLYQ